MCTLALGREHWVALRYLQGALLGGSSETSAIIVGGLPPAAQSTRHLLYSNDLPEPLRLRRDAFERLPCPLSYENAVSRAPVACLQRGEAVQTAGILPLHLCKPPARMMLHAAGEWLNACQLVSSIRDRRPILPNLQRRQPFPTTRRANHPVIIEMCLSKHRRLVVDICP